MIEIGFSEIVLEPELIGLLGATLIVVGWIPVTLKTIRERSSGMDFKFDVAYAAGSALLAAYAALIGAWLFAVLNALAFTMACVGIYFKAFKHFKKWDVTKLEGL